MLSPENRALVGRVVKDDADRHTAHKLGGQYLNRLLDAAREEGLDQGRDEAAQDAAGESL